VRAVVTANSPSRCLAIPKYIVLILGTRENTPLMRAGVTANSRVGA